MEQVANPVGEATNACNAHDKRDNRKAFPPLGIGQRQVMLVLNGTEKELAHNAEDVDGGYHNRAACDDGEGAVEEVGLLERTNEDGHFAMPYRQSRSTLQGKA